MKEIKTIKPLTGNPKIDKYLLTSTPLRTLIDGIPLKWRLLWDTGIEADKLYELMVSYYEEKEFIDDYTFASNLIEKELKLDYYLHSKDAGIRRNVAKKGYGLNVLVNDPNTLVRITIAKNGWCLDQLKHDKVQTFAYKLSNKTMTWSSFLTIHHNVSLKKRENDSNINDENN